MTLSAQDIVERLRKAADVHAGPLGKEVRLEWEAADTISRLTADNEALRKENAELMTRDDPTFTHSFKVRAEKAESRVTALEAQVGRLQEALKPFATYLDTAKYDLDNKGDPLPDDLGMGWVYLTVGDFRRARAAFANEEAGG